MSIEFLVTALIIVATPGVGALYTISAGLRRGGKASVLAAFASTVGIVPHLIAAMTGVAAILHSSAVAYEALRWLGVAYLLYMAWQTWRERGSLQLDEGSNAEGWRVILEGILLNLLNPKLSIFFFAFLPQFIPATDPAPLAKMLLLSGVFMAMTFVVFAIYGLFAAAMRDHVISRPVILTWMRRTFAAAFVALGARLALSRD
jgi:threonine/homoserine/homoserine lactone efflux protein